MKCNQSSAILDALNIGALERTKLAPVPSSRPQGVRSPEELDTSNSKRQVLEVDASKNSQALVPLRLSANLIFHSRVSFMRFMLRLVGRALVFLPDTPEIIASFNAV